ncbi:MAG TPA: O-antigen ligase family protein [Solirubrobacteraceae bacterium]|nr:O-antigen ligase family protein [Solirubrobacteraceae bacterium]
MNTTEQTAPVIELKPRSARSRVPRRADRLNLVVLMLAAALAFSPLSFGYYSFTSWAPLGIGAVVLLVVLAFGPAVRTTGFARTASVGLGLMLVLSFASILWAESRDSAWTSANQIAIYAVIFAIGLLAIRRHATARAVMVMLGLPALISSLVLAFEFAAGSGGGAFLQGRLDSPMGYINGTAGLLVMGIWPWLAMAETAKTRELRAAAISAAALIASMAVLTQSRAIVLATVATIVLVLIAAPGRTRRGVNLLIVLAAVAATVHWTLRVYSSTGPSQLLDPSSSAIQQAGFALLAAAAIGFALKWLTSAGIERLPAGRRDPLVRQLGRALLTLTVVAAVAGAVAEHHKLSTQWHDFTALNAEKSAGNRFLAIGGGYRYDLWRIAVDEFKGDPLGGVGAGNFVDQYYLLRHQLEDVTVPHSLELQMLAELGIGGAAGLVLFLAPVLGAGVTRRRTTLANSDPALKIAALGMFAAWLAATSVDWLYDMPGLAGMAMLAAAVLVVPTPTADVYEAAPSRRGRRQQATLVLTLGTLALVAASLGRQYVAALYSNSGQRLVSRQPVNALQELRTAEQLDPWSMQTQYAVASAYARLNDYPAAREALVRAQQLQPQNYVPPALLGDIATRAGDNATAIAAYRRALRLDPLEPALQQVVKTSEAAAK